MVLWALIKNQTPFKGRSNLLAAYATAKVSHTNYFLSFIFNKYNTIICFNKFCNYFHLQLSFPPLNEVFAT